MRRALSLLVVTSLSLSPLSLVYAQDTLTDIPTETPAMTAAPAETPVEMTETALDTPLNAAPNTTVVTANSTNLGEYKEVSCSSDAIFGQNSCNQCFTGKSVKVGERLTDLFDNWNNTSTNVLVAYKDEQKTPNMVAVGANWVPSSSDESKIWKSASDVVWMPSTNGKGDSFMLIAGQKVRFMQSDFGAGYTLESTTQKHGDVIGLLRFPIVYHTLDATTGSNDSAATTHYECVTYTLDAPTTPVEPPVPVTPPSVTKTETGPAETLVLIVAAFFIAFGLMISLRKRA